MGFTYLGGHCDVADLLAGPGTLQEQRWAQLPWELPKSSMEACWWLTHLSNGDDGSNVDMPMTAKLLCKSLAYLRVELHQTSVANIAKLRLERSRRQSLNKQAVKLLREKSHIGNCTREQSNELL